VNTDQGVRIRPLPTLLPPESSPWQSLKGHIRSPSQLVHQESLFDVFANTTPTLMYDDATVVSSRQVDS